MTYERRSRGPSFACGPRDEGQSAKIGQRSNAGGAIELSFEPMEIHSMRTVSLEGEAMTVPARPIVPPRPTSHARVRVVRRPPQESSPAIELNESDLEIVSESATSLARESKTTGPARSPPNERVWAVGRGGATRGTL